MRNSDREKMMGICRSAMTTVAGADKTTLQAVHQMRLRSAGASESLSRELADMTINEQDRALEDFRF